MTHSLHRRGPIERLREDFVLLANTSRVNKERTKPLLAKVAKIVLEEEPSNVGSSVLRTCVPLGLDKEDFVKRIPEAHALLSSWSSKVKLRRVLTRLKEADMGISVTVSGVIEEVIPLVQEIGLRPHTINLSMGILGKTKKLPSEEILEMTTMCGHSLVARNLVKKGVAEVAAGRMTPREASLMIGKPCVCGIYNLDRSDVVLQERTAGEKAKKQD